MAIPMTCHVEPVVGSGAASVVATCQRVEEPCKICCRKWSRVVAVNTACQGVMELRRVRRREWSSVVRYCGLSGGPDWSAKVRLESVARSGTRRSSGKVFSQSE